MRFQWITAAMAALALSAIAADEASIVPPAMGVSAVQLGEAHFRRGDFDRAAQSFKAAAESNPADPRAWWGLGRIAVAHFQRDQARDLFAKAYRLDPRDPGIVLSFLDGVSDPDARATLLRNVIAFSRTTDPSRAALAAARLEIEHRLAGKPSARIAVEYAPYRIPLSGFRPTGKSQDGLLVAVSINGGKPLRLVLDTGARGILIDARAARSLGLEPIVASEVGGFGAGEPGRSRVHLARSLAIGDLRFDDCLVEVSSSPAVVSGADGVLGTGIFEAFRMRVDPRERTLDLTPLPSEAAANTIGLQGLMLVRTAVAGKEGWFLLDSGAAYSTLSRDLAPPAWLKGAAADLFGVRGVLSGAYRLSPVSLSVAGRTLVDMEPVALDLSAISDREGVEISGVLGYSALSKRPFSLDLRHVVLSFE